MGIDYSTLMSMDIKIYTDYKYGCMQSKEVNFNNTQTMLHNIAAKVAEAVWGNRNFTKELKKVDWTSDILYESQEERIYKRQEAYRKRLEEKYGRPINRINGGT